jgi:hypothetical protein
VTDHIEVKRVVVLLWDELFQFVVGLFARYLLSDEAQPLGNPVDVRIYGEGRTAQGKEQHNRSRLGAYSLDRA